MSAVCSKVFQELLEEGELCDAVIKVNNADFKVHKIILCSCSQYFRNLFTHKPPSLKLVYNFPHVAPKIMGLILQYAYTCSVMVTEENVIELLATAKYFAVEGIVKSCCVYLEQQLSFNNCIDIWKLADCHGCEDLRQKAYHYILYHFERVAESTVSFPQLSVEQLADIIARDELNVRQESAVFEAIRRWIDYAPEERKGHMATLLSKVRLLLMPIEYMVSTVSKNTLVRSSKPCLNMIITAMKTMGKSRPERPLTNTRLPSAVLLAMSGLDADPTDRIEIYNVRANRWMVMCNGGEAPRGLHGCVFLNGFIYHIGGFDRVSHLSSVHKFNLTTKTWQEVGSMHSARCNPSVVTLNGYIYALGGCDSLNKLNTAERYKPDMNQWTLIAPMHDHRSDACAAALHGKVYICGGYDEQGPLSTAECYNPTTNQWTVIASMEIGRNGSGAIAYKDQLYVAGGYNGINYMNDVTSYDPLSNYWRTLPPMINARCNFGIAVLEDQLYVVGGFTTTGAMSKVERYDWRTNKWYVVQGMEAPRGNLSCSVVERDHNTTAYLS